MAHVGAYGRLESGRGGVLWGLGAEGEAEGSLRLGFWMLERRGGRWEMSGATSPRMTEASPLSSTCHVLEPGSLIRH